MTQTSPSSASEPVANWYPAPDDAASVAQVRELFATSFGTTPDGVWAAPGRVNLLGEHVDYNGGRCLPIALPHRTYAAFRRRDDDLMRVVSDGLGEWSAPLSSIEPGTDASWAGYIAGVAWALQQEFGGADAQQAGANDAGHSVSGFEVALISRVPIGAGLSSSAAVEASVGIAIAETNQLALIGSDEGRTRLAAMCVRAENDIAGAPTGGMDQTTSLRARAGHALAIDCRDFSIRHIPLDLSTLGLALLVIDTHAHHALTDGQYGSRRSVCERAADELGVEYLADIAPSELEATLERLSDDEARRRVRHVVTEIERVDRAVDVVLDSAPNSLGQRLGELFNASHVSMRDDYEISCAELDLACETALAAGALGARMTGGGFGGSSIALVQRDQAEHVAQAIAEAFAAAGFTAPEFLLATPDDAAHRLV